MLRFLTAGESHGPALVGILEGIPAGLELEAAHIDQELARRQQGHGRGARQRIERDRARILAGVRHGKTLGSPIALLVENLDHKNWAEVMQAAPTEDSSSKRVSVPRPGHADLGGSVKYGHQDMRNVLERASARETAMRVALGSVARRLLEELGVTIASRVTAIGDQHDPTPLEALGPLESLNARSDASPVRCPSEEASRRMVAAIDAAKADRDSLGGLYEVIAVGLAVGLGSYVQWDRRLEGQLAQSLMSLNAIKGVEIGLGFRAAEARGSAVHDPIGWSDDGSRALRTSNRSGGIEGGMTTGSPLVVRCAMKPISTLMRPLPSVNLDTGESVAAHVERADICAVPAAAVISEAIVALCLAQVVLEKLGGDSMEEVLGHAQSSWRN